MKKQHLLKTMLLLCALVVGSSTLWADEITYTFTSKSWAATSGGSAANWTSGQDGNELTSGRGVKVQTNASGANATSPTSLPNITKIVVTYSTNSSNGAGAIKFKVGSGTEKSQDVTKSGGTSDRTLTYNFSPSESGNVKITVTCTTNSIYVKSVTITYSSKPSAGISVSDKAMYTGASLAFTDLYTMSAADYDGTLNFESDDDEIVSVDNVLRKINAVATGTAKITITADATAKYAAINEEFDVTVSNRAAVTPEGASAGGYSLVTSASAALQAGDKLLLVNETDGKAMGAQSGNYRSLAGVTISSHTIASISDDVKVITLEGEAGAWYLNADGGYLYASSSDNNYMGTEAEKDANNNAKATISIDGSGNATIVFQGTNTRNHIRYNSSSTRFSCYAESSSVETKPMIYRKNDATSFDVTIGSTGWRTMVSAYNVSLPDDGTKAYIVTAGTENSVTLTEVNKVVKNTPVLLKGDEGDHTLTVVADASYAETNLLQISNATTGNTGFVYVLANEESGVGFYKWTRGNLGAGRVYLPSDYAGSGARDFISFETETTGIENVNSEAKTFVGVGREFFNLAGQRIAQPTKGLYIVNGKKVVIK